MDNFIGNLNSLVRDYVGDKNTIKYRLEKLIPILQESQKIGIDKNTFYTIFSVSISILDFTINEVSDEFMISKSTALEWSNGDSAPHTSGIKPVFELLEYFVQNELNIWNGDADLLKDCKYD